MIRADLHIHSCLSPCGDLDMGPSAVLDKIVANHLDLFALTDHNSTRNCRAFMEIAESRGIRCIPGIEVTSSEEAHILCYFDSLLHAERFGELIEESLLPIPLDMEAMGMQVVVNADEEVEDMVANYLSVASSYTISEIVELAHSSGGLVIPAHVDKPVFSIISQLGFIPDNHFDGIEISYGCLMRHEECRISYQRPIISGSDAHYLDDIGRVWIESSADISAPISDILTGVTGRFLR